MGIAAVLFAVAFVAFLTYHLWKHIQFHRIIDKIHGPEPYWIVGNALHFKRNAFEWFEQSAGVAELWSNPRVYRVWFFLTPYVVVTGAAEAEPILNNTKQVLKSCDYEFIRPWVGRGLFANEGEPWRPRRRLMTHVFHNDIIRNFVPVFHRQAKILAKKLAVYSDKSPFDIFRHLSVYALAAIWEAGMGTDMDIQSNSDSEYVRAIHRLGDIVNDRQRAPWLWTDLIFKASSAGKEHDACLKVIHGLVADMVDKRWRKVNADGRDQNQNKTNETVENYQYRTAEGFAILDFWLDQVKKGVLTLKDVNEEANSLLFGGFETTATSSSWTIHYIGCYPEVQAKIHQELDAVFGTDDDREITHEDLRNLAYLDYCIKESLRISPPAPVVGRKLAEDAVIAGRLVPAGTQLFVDINAIHHDPNHWPDPHQYIPERHIPENAAGRHPFAYIPFSAGIRNCIAQRFAMVNEKVLLATLLRRYKVKSLERQDQIRGKSVLVFKPSRIIVELTPRR